MNGRPALPRSGLARRVINGLSSSTSGQQAQSVPWATAGRGGCATPAELPTHSAEGAIWVVPSGPHRVSTHGPSPVWLSLSRRAGSFAGNVEFAASPAVRTVTADSGPAGTLRTPGAVGIAVHQVGDPGEPLSLSEPQFPHLRSGGDSSHPTGCS